LKRRSLKRRQFRNSKAKPYEPAVRAPFDVSSLLNGKAERRRRSKLSNRSSANLSSLLRRLSNLGSATETLTCRLKSAKTNAVLHNDARRFARLLVSEIKLINEQKVKEGREAQDLYERLREAIDRSRDMYDKRVQPPVAAKFDYFHYELVSSLAEGEEGKLGGNYPGATV
jgi:hypothetical protein